MRRVISARHTATSLAMPCPEVETKASGGEAPTRRVAIFERIEADATNPNIVLEVGYLFV
jgi:hypothetical protein